MFDHPIQVLDSHLRFTNLLDAAGALGGIGRASVDPVIARRGQLVANLWRCGWDVTAAEDGESFRLQFTRAPLESWEVSYEALRAVAPFVVNGSFLLFAGDHRSVQQVRFSNHEAVFERGRLAFVPHGPDALTARGGHVVIGIDDRELAPIHATWLARELVPLLLDMRMARFEIRAELNTRVGRSVKISGPHDGRAR